MEYKKERLSKDPHCSKYKNQRNILALEVTTDGKVYDGKVMPKLIELFEKKQ